MLPSLKFRLIVTFLLCGTLLSPGARAQVMTQPDQAFLRSAASGSATELAIARLAAERAERPDVKAYAATLVHDHEAFDSALRSLAAKRGLTLPAGVPPQGRAVVDRLAQQSGSRFDRSFLAESRRINATRLQAFRTEADRTGDTDVGTFIAGFLPMDEQHEAGARALEGTNVARMNRPARPAGAMPVIPPPAGGTMPVIRPPNVGSNMPVIPPSGPGATPAVPPAQR